MDFSWVLYDYSWFSMKSWIIFDDSLLWLRFLTMPKFSLNRFSISKPLILLFNFSTKHDIIPLTQTIILNAFKSVVFVYWPDSVQCSPNKFNAHLRLDSWMIFRLIDYLIHENQFKIAKLLSITMLNSRVSSRRLDMFCHREHQFTC